MADEAINIVNVVTDNVVDKIIFEHEQATLAIMAREPETSKSAALARALRIMLHDERERVAR